MNSRADDSESLSQAGQGAAGLGACADLLQPQGQDQAIDSESLSSCKICLKQKSRYTCPRCNITYCSVDCYKSVSHANCSESFYKDCFMEGLKEMKTPDEKQKVMEMLKRVSEQDNPLDSDDDEDDDLCERLEGIDLDDDTDALWSCLNAKEKAEFQSMMGDGRLGELVELWKPWWCSKKEPTLVQELTGDDLEDDNNLSCDSSSSSEIPSLCENIPDIDVLLKNKSPSEAIKYSVIGTLFGYAYITRLYNGDYVDIPEQSALEMLVLCPSLGVHTFHNTESAVDACIQCLANQAKSVFVSQEFTVGVLQDVQLILQGASHDEPLQYILAALSDLHVLFSKALEAFKNKKKSKNLDRSTAMFKSSLGCTSNKDVKMQIFSACKKCEFFLAWVQKYGVKLEPCSVDLEIMFCEMTSRLADHKRTQDKLKKLQSHIPRKHLQKLIEEVPVMADDQN